MRFHNLFEVYSSDTGKKPTREFYAPARYFSVSEIEKVTRGKIWRIKRVRKLDNIFML
jgi:hypothetical protein